MYCKKTIVCNSLIGAEIGVKRAENQVSGSGAVSGVGEIDMSGERIFWSSAGV